ncbi:hypothetical protein [Streptomyces sp. MW-W600-10]|uniref:hypothetical protein n=1 Tax=Streptomyces sp. MW-W600-10 TaxID=2829819 RepID=UPI00210D8096|nr:hypothetical protein [Streptomyces sp. MW-W600-10]
MGGLGMDAVTGDVVIGCPVVVRADHRVSTDDLVADLERRQDHPKLRVWLRMLRSTGVEWRPWSASLEETAERAGWGCGHGPRTRRRVTGR